MKVAISAKKEELSAEQDPRFGRCEAFYIYDTETQEGKFLQNPWKEAAGGAGTKAAELMIQEGVQQLVSGHFGPNAERVLKTGGVERFIGKGASLQDTLKALLEGSLTRED